MCHSDYNKMSTKSFELNYEQEKNVDVLNMLLWYFKDQMITKLCELNIIKI